jgi:hypothetical protein
MRISRLEADLPYLPARGGGDGLFLDWVKELGFSLPSTNSVRDAVDAELIRPLFRFPVPPGYFFSWKDYPVLGTAHEIDKSEILADRLYYSAGGPGGTLYRLEGRPRGMWFIHPFDREGSSTAKALKHSQEARTLARPDPFTHEKGYVIHPWIDYFGYWQAYELLEKLSLTEFRLSSEALASEPNSLADAMQRLQKWSAASVQATTKRWTERSPAFSVIGRYRAMRAALALRDDIWLGPKRPPRRRLRHAAIRLAERLGVSHTALENHVVTLLKLVWEWKAFPPTWLSGGGFGSLRKDILCGAEWLTLLTGLRFDHYYDVWTAPDRQPRPVATLEEALPFQYRVAESFFLRHFNSVGGYYYGSVTTGVRFRPENLRELVRRIRRKTWMMADWCVYYQRLHESLGPGPQSDWAGIEEPATVRHLLLLTLLAEKILLFLTLEHRPKLKSKVPDVKPLLELAASNLERRDRRFKGAWTMASDNWKLTSLRRMPRDPFLPVSQLQLAGTQEAVELAKACLRFAISRNYFAHHFYQDGRLVGTQLGGETVSGVVIPTLFFFAGWLGGKRLWG